MTLDILTSAAALGVLVRMILTADRMCRTTRHGFRIAVIMMAVVMLWAAVWPFYKDWPAWGDLLVYVTFLLYVVTDKRARACEPSSSS